MQVGVLASGSGTILRAMLQKGLPIAAVVSDRPCGALEIAADAVAIAGFGTILSKPFVDAYGGRAVNTHPALLPSFKGWHAVRDALEFGVKVTGCTVHLVTEDVDAGPILAQEAVPVLGGDSEATLHERIKEVERRLYPEVIATLTRANA